MKSIFIQTIPSEKLALLMENNELKQLTFDRLYSHSLVGNIYLGRVVRIDHGLQSTFIDIGLKKPAFLNKKEIPQSRENTSLPIEQLIQEGMAIIVQVIKDPFGNKGPSVTANITIPGHYSIFLPFGNYMAFSRKMREDVKSQLKETYKNWIREKEGAIVRTAAEKASEDELQQEWLHLQKQWDKIVLNAKNKKPPFILYSDSDVPNRFLRKYAISNIDEIVFDENEMAQAMKKSFPQLANKIRWEDNFLNKLPISINQLIEKVSSKVVTLSSGVELVIEKTEAMIVIDVNSASYIGKYTKEDTVFQTNRLAVKEIANQIRLRNLAGMILIDFIDMKNQQSKEVIVKEMKELVKQDPAHCEVHGFTKLGILELTRKREGVDTFSLFCKREKNVFNDLEKAFMLERELLAYRKKDTAAFLVEASSNIIENFLKNVDIEKLKKYIKIPVFYEIKSFDERPFVIKFIGDVKWIHHGDTGAAIDKLF